MTLQIVQKDITTMAVDAIVNAANSRLQMGGGVCGAIFRAAGAKELQEACDKIGHCPVGEAVITDGFRLPAKFIIHTVGPVWQGGHQQEAELLASCYQESLKLAKEHGCRSIAFPVISSGIFGYPRREALEVAITAIQEFLKENEMDVYIAVIDQDMLQMGKALLKS
ncbi:MULTISPECIES: macro domain-containing protein [Ureibacillus]|uniref:Macro domain-containing protein n=1 Tax=Ureibacillus terrenus TaxID=118246 RepID=A0A540V3W8_9BACL|nr:macro domain-containing protein [Ureibacillus terrenus]